MPGCKTRNSHLSATLGTRAEERPTSQSLHQYPPRARDAMETRGDMPSCWLLYGREDHPVPKSPNRYATPKAPSGVLWSGDSNHTKAFPTRWGLPQMLDCHITISIMAALMKLAIVVPWSSHHTMRSVAGPTNGCVPPYLHKISTSIQDEQPSLRLDARKHQSSWPSPSAGADIGGQGTPWWWRWTARRSF